MLPSRSSTDSNMRKGTKRKRSNASNDSMQSGRKRETKHCVQEGRWPCHPQVSVPATQTNLEVLSLQLGLHGISKEEVRELGLWIYLKAHEAWNPRVCSEARSILDTKLEEADMYQHLSVFREMLPEDALSEMHKIIHQLVLAKAYAKRVAETQQATEASTSRDSPNNSIDDLQELYASFLEQHAQHTCRVVERRMRCIQLKQDLREAEGTESYPQILYRSLWRNEQGAWSQFLHERDLEDMWLPM